METEYLNFHDVEHFADFELQLNQHDLLDDSDGSLMAIVDTDFDYIEKMDTSGGLWGTEQELNGDMAVLPDSGVASVIPKIENIKEDFAKVLSDWQEHIGYMQASDFEEDIDMSVLNIPMAGKLHTDLPDDIFHNEIIHPITDKKTHITVISPIKKNSPSFPLIDLKPILTNLSILPDEILQSKSPVKKTVSPLKIKIETDVSEMIKSNIKLEEKTDTEDCIDIETVPEHEPVLEAGDVKSLLEQFEASEVGISQTFVNTEIKPTKNSSKTNNKKHTDQMKRTLSKKLVQSEESKLHKNIRDSLPEEVIDRIKASGRKKVSVISAISDSTKPNNTNRVNRKNTTNSRNRTTKITATDIKITNKIDGFVQLDHDYCSSIKSNCDGKSIGRKKLTVDKNKKNSISKVNERIQRVTAERENNSKKCESWIDNNSRKDSGLESGDVSDASEEPTLSSSVSSNLPIIIKTNQRITQMNRKSVNNSCNINNDETNTKPPAYAMKIRSALATSILQLRDSVLTKTKSIDNGGGHKTVQMVSVLKKPPLNKNILLKNKSNESIVTTKDSSNNEVQNIIVQDIPALASNENEKKPPRKKLNLAEYRSRREQGRSDNSRTCSPIQPMTLVYIHHASTTTEPIKDDPTNPIWSEREIVSMLKPKSEVEDNNKNRSKPTTREIATQTNDSTFENLDNRAPKTTEIIDIEEPHNDERRNSRLNDRKQRSYRQQRRDSSSSSRSRSRSRSRSSRSTNSSRSRNRRRSTRSRSQSLNRRRTRTRRSSRSSSRSTSRSQSLSRRRNARRRRISHRRSSVSSNSTWSSRSLSTSSSSYSRSTSSRSRSSSRYSSCSRSSSRSNLERNKRSGHHRREECKQRTSYNRQSRGSSRSYYGDKYRNQRRSSSYRRPHDVWCHQEKKRQVEERRVIYVGRLEETITKADLRRRFEAFGPVLDISLHFREHGDNYGFVTFAYKNDAYEAVEHGNDDPSLSRYDLCFGGRRAFCKVKYADLDGMASSSFSTARTLLKADEDNTFDLLLKEAKAKLRNRKV